MIRVSAGYGLSTALRVETPEALREAMRRNALQAAKLSCFAMGSHFSRIEAFFTAVEISEKRMERYLIRKNPSLSDAIRQVQKARQWIRVELNQLPPSSDLSYFNKERRYIFEAPKTFSINVKGNVTLFDKRFVEANLHWVAFYAELYRKMGGAFPLQISDLIKQIERMLDDVSQRQLS